MRIYNIDQGGAKTTLAKEVLLYKPGEVVDVTRDGSNFVKSIAPGLQGEPHRGVLLPSRGWWEAAADGMGGRAAARGALAWCVRRAAFAGAPPA